MTASTPIEVADSYSGLGRDVLEMLGSKTTASDLEQAMTIVRGEHESVRRWLSDLRDHQLDAILGRSYWHPNGFAKIVLEDPEPGVGPSIRLHVWPASEGAGRRGDTAPHGHRWDFASTVICGQGLLVEHFVDHPEGELWRRYTFAPAVASELVPDGVGRLRGTEYVFRPCDDAYVCDIAVVHTVATADDVLTATLVLQGPVQTEQTVVYLPCDMPPDPGRVELTADELRHLIDDVVTDM